MQFFFIHATVVMFQSVQFIDIAYGNVRIDFWKTATSSTYTSGTSMQSTRSCGCGHDRKGTECAELQPVRLSHGRGMGDLRMRTRPPG